MPRNERWADDAVQFPRLLAEVYATQDLDWAALAASMDLTEAEVRSLFERAEREWERIVRSVVEGGG